MSLFAFTRLSRTQFGPGQWKSWRHDFQSSAVHGKGCMHISVWTHLKCFLSNILCKLCFRNYIHLGSRIMSDNKTIHVSVSISISVYNYIYVYVSIYIS